MMKENKVVILIYRFFGLFKIKQEQSVNISRVYL